MFAVMPIMIFVGWIETQTMVGAFNDEKGGNESGNIIQENITNIKTVRAINTVEKTIELYEDNLEKRRPLFKK